MRDEVAASYSDSRGYYAVLGVDPLADATEIKAAYRSRVKILHPDRNPGDEAAREFLKVNEAYHVLSNGRRRAAYDVLFQDPPLLDPDDPLVPSLRPLACSHCGSISAQPRYLVFHQVKSYLLWTRHETIKGIFCRDCAERVAIRASILTWARGWWGPVGPIHTILALCRNLAGGDKPRAENMGMLLYQARAFLARGDDDIAGALVGQARRFAVTSLERRRIGALASAIRTSRRVLRNRWKGFGYATLVQAVPLLVLFVSAIWGAAVLAGRDRQSGVNEGFVVSPAQARLEAPLSPSSPVGRVPGRPHRPESVK